MHENPWATIDGITNRAYRRLSINGTGASGAVGQATGLKAINATSFGKLYVENCYIQNFAIVGIDVSLTSSGSIVSIKDTNVTQTVNGIQMATTAAGGFVGGVLDNVRVENCTNGILAKDRAFLIVRNSVAANNSTVGMGIQAPSNSAAVNIENTVIFNSSTGVQGGGPGTKIDLSHSSILNNTTGVSSGGGTLNSHGNNSFGGNSSDGAALTEIGQK